jgi:hypothetical protein
MKCRYSEHDVALFVEGDLEPAKAAEVQVHLVTCEVCRELEADVRESQTVLKSLRQEMVSSAALSFVRNRVLEEVSQVRVRPVWGRWVYALAGAMFVAVVSVSVILHTTSSRNGLVEGGRADGGRSPREPDRTKPSADAIRSSIPEIERTTPSAPFKVATRHLLNGRSHPSFSKEGNGGIAEAAPAETPKEVVVKLLTDDPNIVIYWLVEQKNGGTL